MSHFAPSHFASSHYASTHFVGTGEGGGGGTNQPPPVALVTSPTMDQVVGAVVHVFFVQGADPDGDPLTHRWEWRAGTSGPWTRSGVIVNGSPFHTLALPNGAYQIRIVTSDGTFEVFSAAVNFTVQNVASTDFLIIDGVPYPVVADSFRRDVDALVGTEQRTRSGRLRSSVTAVKMRWRGTLLEMARSDLDFLAAREGRKVTCEGPAMFDAATTCRLYLGDVTYAKMGVTELYEVELELKQV